MTERNPSLDNLTGVFTDTHRVHRSPDHVTCHMAMDGRVSLAALLRRLHHEAPGVPVSRIAISGANVTWADKPTEDELAALMRNRQKREERIAEWKRNAYLRLKAEFEPDDPA